MVPANLLEPCYGLQELESGQGKVIALWAVDTVGKYNDCAAKVDAYIKIHKPPR